MENFIMMTRWQEYVCIVLCMEWDKWTELNLFYGKNQFGVRMEWINTQGQKDQLNIQ